MRYTPFVLVVFTLLIGSPSSAQDTFRFGLVMGYPAQIGVLWNVSDRVALRPEIGWTKASGESTATSSVSISLPSLPAITTTSTTSSSGWNVGLGLSGLIYLVKGDALRTYVAPGFTYSRSSTTFTSTSTTNTNNIIQVPPSTVGPITTHSSDYTTKGVFGAQYALSARFGLFGELGLAYTHSGATPNVSVGSTTTQRDASNWSLGIRSGVGVILFF